MGVCDVTHTALSNRTTPWRRSCGQHVRPACASTLQVICFAFHDSSLLLETCQQAKHESKLVTLFYLD